MTLLWVRLNGYRSRNPRTRIRLDCWRIPLCVQEVLVFSSGSHHCPSKRRIISRSIQPDWIALPNRYEVQFVDISSTLFETLSLLRIETRRLMQNKPAWLSTTSFEPVLLKNLIALQSLLEFAR